LLKKESIDLSLRTVGSPLMAKTTDAVLLQLLLNLFDNSVYWLQQITIPDKKIEILLDGQRGQMIFADNGPGVNKDDAPYIFEPFYSGKGEEGRGLGLYIARQLLERSEYSINLIELKNDKILSGANFVVNFIAEEN
jgi:signal transduction histidine kinase